MARDADALRPRRTPEANLVLTLPGANEDSDLWAIAAEDPNTGNTVVVSVWELSGAQRQRIAAGAKIALCVWGAAHPPVALKVTEMPLGRGGDD